MPLLAVALGAIVAGFRFYFTVSDLADKQAKWQSSSEQRRERNRDDMEAVKLELKELKVNVEWLKRAKG